MKMPSLSVEGRVAIVTGARRGMGAAISIALAGAGADLAISDIVADGGELEAVAEKIEALGRRVITIKADATRKREVDHLVKRASDELGFVSILVNNAGGIKPDENKPADVPFHEIPEEDWDRSYDNNFKTCFLCCQSVIKRMVESKKGGSIVNLSSVAAEPRGRGTAYHIGKAAVTRLTSGLAHDYGKFQIRVNAIEPAFTRTEMARNVWESAEVLKQYQALIPLGRIAEPEDIAGLVLFLASDASGFITGQSIVIDGGFLLPHSYEVPDLLAPIKKHRTLSGPKD
jgi:2-dehydro-3-deoxy-D-gluconate 5-dehydrogenase